MADNKMQEKLAKLRARMGKVDTGGARGYWSPPNGVSVIRILPEVKEMEFFFQEVGKHEMWDFGGKEIFCPKYTTSGQFECPICELVNELYKGSEQDKALAKKLGLRRTFWMNIVVRDKDDNGGNTASGPFIFQPKVTIFNGIQALIAGSYGDITDFDTGTDIEIHRKGEKINTDYQVFPRHFRGDLPLHVDDKKLEEIMEKAQDLTWVMLSDDPEEDNKLGEGKVVRLFSYDRMLAEYGIGPEMDLSKLEEKKPSTSSPARDSIRARRDGRSGREPQMDDEVPFPATAERNEDEVGQTFRELRAQRRGATT